MKFVLIAWVLTGGAWTPSPLTNREVPAIQGAMFDNEYACREARELVRAAGAYVKDREYGNRMELRFTCEPEGQMIYTYNEG